MTQTIKLTHDSMIALIQGEKITVTDKENTFTFLPPDNGIFITYEQLAHLRYRDSVETLIAIKEMQKHLQRIVKEVEKWHGNNP